MADQQAERRSWWQTDVNRRTVLKGSAGAMAVLVIDTAFSLDAAAQQSTVEGPQFFNRTEALTVEAIAERLWPATDESPGATEAGVVIYIDRALAGPYVEYQLRYRTGIEALDEVSEDAHGEIFRRLTPEQQDAVLTGIEAGDVERQPREGLEGEPPVSQDLEQQFRETQVGDRTTQIAGLALAPDPSLATFFNLVRTHTMEGLFADPIYGGNRDFAGWRAVGYPGPYYVYTEEEQQSFEPLDKPFQSIADL